MHNHDYQIISKLVLQEQTGYMALLNIPIANSQLIWWLQEVLGKKLSLVNTILTVLAPTNSAFEALAESLGMSIEELLEQPIIKQIILYHVLPELKNIAEIAFGELLSTLLQGEKGIKVCH